MYSIIPFFKTNTFLELLGNFNFKTLVAANSYDIRHVVKKKYFSITVTP